MRRSIAVLTTTVLVGCSLTYVAERIGDERVEVELPVPIGEDPSRL